MPISTAETGARRPYFEVLFVNSQPAARWPALAGEARRLRRPEDAFVCAADLRQARSRTPCARRSSNPDIAAVVLARGLPLPLASRCAGAALRTRSLWQRRKLPDKSALRLARALKRIRPELDIYLLSDREVEKLAGDPAADAVRRLFYAVEEPLELHLAILEGVQARYETPFFDDLKELRPPADWYVPRIAHRSRQVGVPF